VSHKLGPDLQYSLEETTFYLRIGAQTAALPSKYSANASRQQLPVHQTPPQPLIKAINSKVCFKSYIIEKISNIKHLKPSIFTTKLLKYNFRKLAFRNTVR